MPRSPRYALVRTSYFLKGTVGPSNKLQSLHSDPKDGLYSSPISGPKRPLTGQSAYNARPYMDEMGLYERA